MWKGAMATFLVVTIFFRVEEQDKTILTNPATCTSFVQFPVQTYDGFSNALSPFVLISQNPDFEFLLFYYPLSHRLAWQLTISPTESGQKGPTFEPRRGAGVLSRTPVPSHHQMPVLDLILLHYRNYREMTKPYAHWSESKPPGSFNALATTSLYPNPVQSSAINPLFISLLDPNHSLSTALILSISNLLAISNDRL